MGWWNDKLSGATPAAPPPPPPMYAPQQQVQQPAQAPQGFQQQPQQPQQPPPADGQHIQAGQAWQIWQGGKGVQDAQKCPSCDSEEYFSRSNLEGMPSRTGPPAPQCFSCGYPIVQFASKTGTGGASQAVKSGGGGEVAGRAREARGFQTGAHLDQIVAKVQ